MCSPATCLLVRAFLKCRRTLLFPQWHTGWLSYGPSELTSLLLFRSCFISMFHQRLVQHRYFKSSWGPIWGKWDNMSERRRTGAKASWIQGPTHNPALFPTLFLRPGVGTPKEIVVNVEEESNGKSQDPQQTCTDRFIIYLYFPHDDCGEDQATGGEA